MPIRRTLEGQRFFVTGATGFLGTAVVERILRSIPDAQVTVLVRPGRRASAAQRTAREIVKNGCFDRLREELGGRFDDEMARRLLTVAGDVGRDGLGLDDEGLSVLGRADVVVHSAATVSFDAPLDQAVETNLLGPARVAAAMAAARRALAEAGEAPADGHLITVSTAYVAGTHQGEAKEELLSTNRFTIDVDWEAEVTYARRLRQDLQTASRRPEQLAKLTKRARDELGPAGDHLLAARTERLREDWVRQQMVEAGSARAQALGWPDAYPFTKALGERVLVERHQIGVAPAADAVPITIVRPSIIESSLAEPRPGWIRGFRMAEPIIISYARGLLAQFPGVPEGVVDVIPVDLVVAAILAVAAKGPDPTGPTVVQVASGVVNPLGYAELVAYGEDFFGRNPLYDERGQPISVPEWSFPGRGKVQRQLRRTAKAMDLAERVLQTLPLRGRQADLSARLDERQTTLKRALTYVELYGAYTETEARYRVDRLLELWAEQDDEDRRDFCFDPHVIDWDHYVLEVHLPSVLEHARVRTTPGGRSAVADRPTRAKRAILSPDRHLAVFDLEHTLIASNVVDSYAWLASRHLPPGRRAAFVADLVAEGPRLLALDRQDRGDFLRFFYRRYEGASVEELAADSWDLFHRELLPRSFPEGLARVRQHRRLGHRTLLITGALDVVVSPLEPLFDDIVCAHLGRTDGRFTGHLNVLPPIGEARATLLEDYTARHGLSLAESVAYADSASDLPMLEAVGFPVAVNPETRLAAIARRRGWHVEHWSKSKGGAAGLLPLGPLDRGTERSRQTVVGRRRAAP
ncbi:MAG TPA: SDR family oxidoreductase [Acidimicrobiales bacterium]|nr:SDR family oxidoreductase [Acidimicrobiales bacterium]